MLDSYEEEFLSVVKGEGRNGALSGAEVAKKTSIHREESETDMQKETKIKC